MRVISKIDFGLLASNIALIFFGLLSLLSTNQGLLKKQLVWILISFSVAFLIVSLDLRSFFRNKGFIYILYFLSLILLVFTFILAPSINGNRAWLVIGPFQFQPSEIVKVVMIIFLSYFFAKKHMSIALWRTAISSFMYAMVPIVLIAIQPDFGSASVMFAIYIGFILFAGLSAKKVVLLAIILALGSMMLWNFVLQDYQKARITGFLNPNENTLGINYSVIQSKIAIGSGGLFGKGFKQGTQTQLGFLPEAQTDFIFAAITEEFGLFTATALILSFLWMVFRILKIGMLADSNMLKFICLGTAVMFLVQFAFNVGSNIGILPVVGVAFPFVSYGGSSMLAGMSLMGIIQSFYARR